MYMLNKTIFYLQIQLEDKKKTHHHLQKIDLTIWNVYKMKMYWKIT